MAADGYLLVGGLQMGIIRRGYASKGLGASVCMVGPPGAWERMRLEERMGGRGHGSTASVCKAPCRGMVENGRMGAGFALGRTVAAVAQFGRHTLVGSKSQ